MGCTMQAFIAFVMHTDIQMKEVGKINYGFFILI